MPLRTWSFFPPAVLTFFLLFAAPVLFAQQEPPPIEAEEWFDFEATPYSPGDMAFTIKLGVIFPTVFWGDLYDDPQYGQRHNLSLGGTGSLVFDRFLTPNIFFGGQISGTFAPTLARESMLFMVPFGVRLGYQFVFQRFEVPISLMAGMANQMIGDASYFGPILKPGASLFWRFNPDWSFGLNAVWWFVPQFPSERPAVYGNFMTVTLSFRYHF
ncbi:MAG: hypothetical protein FWC64_11085 [Treponema sp.]|nr:hypothetical protein [Treponema sp.]